MLGARNVVGGSGPSQRRGPTRTGGCRVTHLLPPEPRPGMLTGPLQQELLEGLSHRWAPGTSWVSSGGRARLVHQDEVGLAVSDKFHHWVMFTFRFNGTSDAVVFQDGEEKLHKVRCVRRSDDIQYLGYKIANE